MTNVKGGIWRRPQAQLDAAPPAPGQRRPREPGWGGGGGCPATRPRSYFCIRELQKVTIKFAYCCLRINAFPVLNRQQGK